MKLENLRLKIKKSILKIGILGTVKLSFMRLKVAISSKGFGVSKKFKEISEEFDKRYGTDTSTVMYISESVSPNWIYANRYEPIGLIDFAEIMSPLKIPYEKTVFIDLGSGKGLACLLASLLPFQKIMGVELSDDLKEIAERNFSLFPKSKQRCSTIEMVCMDAVNFQFPLNDLVLYMYNPFEGPLMEKVIDNFVKSYHLRRRRMTVVYFNPKLGSLWDKIEFLNKRFDCKSYCIYDSGGAPLGAF